MVAEGTIVHMELRDTAAILSPLPEHIYVTQFTNDEDYLVVSNLTSTPYTLTLRDAWTDRQTGKCANEFMIPVKRMVFLKKNK